MAGRVIQNKQEVNLKSNRVYWTLFFLLLAVYFRFIGGTWLIHINSYYHSVLNTGIVFFVFLIWIIWKSSRDKKITKTGFEKYISVLILVIILSSVFGENSSLSSEIGVGAIALIFSLYIFLDIKYYEEIWTSLLNAILITGSINTVLIAARIIWWMNQFQIQFVDLLNRPTYVIKIIPRLPDLQNFNANVTAAYLLLLLPLMLFKANAADKKGVRILLWLFGGLTFVELVLTKSRGGYIGLIVSLIASVLLYRKNILKRIKIKPVQSYFILGSIGLGTILGAILVFQSRGMLLGASMIGRIEGWRIALEIIKEKPLFGTGLGGYGLRFMDMRDPAIYSLLNFHAHNELINIATSLGLAGLIAVLMVVWQIIKLGKKENLRSQDIRTAYLVSLAGFLGMGLVDSYFDSSNIALIVIFLIVGLLPENKMSRLHVNRLGIGLMVFGLLFLTAMDVYANWKLYPYHQTRISVMERKIPEAVNHIEEAIRRDPGNKFYDYINAQISSEVICDQESNPAVSINLYEEVLPFFGNWGPININAAYLYSMEGDAIQARVFIQKAINRDPRKSLYHCLLGDNQLSDGLYEQAMSSYGSCLDLDASWADTPYWRSDQNRMKILEEIASKQINTGLKEELIVRAEILFYLDRFDEIEHFIQGELSGEMYLPELGLLYSRFLIGNGEYDKAIAELKKIIGENPRDSEAWYILSKAHLENGDLENSLNSINVSIALESTPENLLYSGLVNTLMGELELAKEQFSRALNWRRPSSSMSAWTARRFPIDLDEIPCKPPNLTFSDFYDVAWHALQELQKVDCEEAKNIESQIDNHLFPGFAVMNKRSPISCGN